MTLRFFQYSIYFIIFFQILLCTVKDKKINVASATLIKFVVIFLFSRLIMKNNIDLMRTIFVFLTNTLIHTFKQAVFKSNICLKLELCHDRSDDISFILSKTTHISINPYSYTNSAGIVLYRSFSFDYLK